MPNRCSFCGQDDRAVDGLVAGHGGVAICGDCARLAVELTSEPAEEDSGDLLLTGIGLLVTNDGRRGGYLGTLEGAAVAIRQGRITWVGRQRVIPDAYRHLPEVDCQGRMVAPGFVDAHRHLEMQADDDLESVTERVAAHLGAALEQGATTVEVRSWGAPGPEQELTMLSAMRAAAATLPTDVVSSMVAGVDPPERGPGYRAMLETVLIPTAARVASYLDVVVGGPLDCHAAATVMGTGRRHGMRPRVHVDSEDGLAVALEGRAVSVDGMSGMEAAASAVAEAGAVMVSVPVCGWVAGWSDPAAAMWEAGAVVGLGTGCREATVPTMPLAMAVAVHHGGLDPDQALWSATRGGALAVEEPDKGQVAPGAVADLILLEAETAADIVAQPGRDPVVRVIKDGALLAG